MSTLLDVFKTMEYGPAPESPAAVNAWLDEHGRKFGLFINNQWVHPKGRKILSFLQPRGWRSCWVRRYRPGKKKWTRR